VDKAIPGLHPFWITEVSIFLSLHPVLIDSIIPFYDFDIGIFSVILYQDSQPVSIVVDDYIPVDGDDNPLFCKNSERNVWFFPILEKAFAKLSGQGYLGLSTFKPGTAFKYLTGGIMEEIPLDSNILFQTLQQCLNRGALITISPAEADAYQSSSISITATLYPTFRLENMRKMSTRLIQLFSTSSSDPLFLPSWSDDWKLLSRRQLKSLGYEESKNTRFIPFKVRVSYF
jgi:hypothetical protein